MTDFRELLQRQRRAKDMFKHIDIGEYALSIQASDTHYSKPRAVLNEPDMYSAWEVAVFKGLEWCEPETHPEVFDGLGLEEYWQFADYGAYIPTTRVQVLYERLLSLEADYD